MKQRNRRALGNAALLVLSTVMTFGVLEFVIGSYLITRTPIKFHFALPRGLAVLAQSSKAGRIPQDYVAIAGDSYAQGKGDWLLETDPAGNGPYHSAHLLQRLSQKDVVSLGKGGASNMKGWSREPWAVFNFISAAIDSDIEPPDLILAYFHAGNDLTDNVVQLRQQFLPEFGEQGLRNSAAWDQFFDEQIANSEEGPYRGINTTLGWLPLAVNKIIRNELKGKQARGRPGSTQLMRAGSINLARVGGEATPLPDGLQSPGMELDGAESELGYLAAGQSLLDLQKRFKQSQIVVVYIPSVLECYEIISEQISVQDPFAAAKGKKQSIFPTSGLNLRSNEVATRIQRIAEQLAIPFIDARPQIGSAGRQELIHGPKDWLHFNKRGYEVLANAIACGVADLKIWPPSACTRSVPSLSP
jgi:hypothetical protein